MSFLDSLKKAVGWSTPGDRLFSTPETPLHPLNDREVWRKHPAYDAPAEVDIAASQRWIDNLMGRTRGESIYKLVWNGDRRYWSEFYTQWGIDGKPTAPAVKWPLIRTGTVRNQLTGHPIRHVFPPRWLILTRLEPEQYADHWRQESYTFDPSIRNFKQIRPDAAPPVFWLWFHTIGHHNDHCCISRAKENKKCWGEYAPPEAARSVLENQHAADLAEGTRSVYEMIDRTFINETEHEINSYRKELEELVADRDYYTENPWSLIGLQPSITENEAKKLVKEYFDKEIQETSNKIEAR